MENQSELNSAPALYDWQTKEYKHEIHMSHLNAYLRCPKQFAAEYIHGERGKPNSVELSVGRVHHNLLEVQLKRKLEGLEDMGFQEISDYMADQTEEQAEFLEDGKETEMREMKDVIIEQALVLQKDYISTLKPRRIEQKFRISIPDSPYDLVGTIDIERELLDEEKVFQNKVFGIDDLKTSASSPGKNDDGSYKPRSHSHFLQQTAYSFGAWIANGGKPSDYKQTLNRTIYLVKNKTPIIRPAVYLVTRDDVLFLYEMLKDFSRALQAGIFIANPDGWWCSPDKCPIFEKCRKQGIILPSHLIKGDNVK